MEPACLIPLSKGSRQVVMVGDQCQLPATVMSVEARRKGLDISLLERLLTLGMEVPPHSCPMPTDALEWKGPRRRPQQRLGRRLEEVAKAVGGGYCRLQIPLRLAFGVRGTVAGHRLGALKRVGGSSDPTGGLARRSDSQWASTASREMMSAPRGWGTQRANPGAPEAPCGKEWWARQGKEPPTKPGVGAEPRTTARQRKSPGTPCTRTPPASTMKCTLPATNKERALRTRDSRSGGAYLVDGRDNAWRSRARGPHTNGNAARQVVDGLRAEVCGQRKQSNDPGNNQHNPQYVNYWAPLTRKRHIPPHPAQPRHTNDGAPRTRKRHQQEHRPQRPTERSDPTQHAKGRTGDCPGPRKETTTRRNVTPL